MSEKFFTVILDMLKEQQLSISAISRELKTKGYDIHRLIITGYLRALYDTGYLEETEIPPSKVYIYNHKKQQKDIYIILEDRLKDVDPEYRYPVAVYILTSLFNRPCFRYELNLIGVIPGSSHHVKESKGELIKKFREDITRFEIPANDKAYEINSNDANVISMGCNVIFSIIKDTMDMTVLKSKYHSTQIWEYDRDKPVVIE
ncbi:hypothetical protein C5S42_08960 [Candidatus Methanomarinus sp.]|nr:hypothetical protein C5S42_08960 [ANME-2 cluster archaeon]